MKRINTIIACLLSLVLFSGCEKELMDYEGVDGLYFDVQYGASWGDTTVWAHQIYSLVAFADKDASDTVGYVRAKIAVAGSIKEYDRPFEIEVVSDSTTMTADEYEILDKNLAIPAGLNCTYVTVKVNKTERMLHETVGVQLRLIPNEHFALPFSSEGLGHIGGRWTDTQTLYGKNVDPSVHTIFANNLLTRPAGWIDVQFGAWSATKYALFLELIAPYGLGKSIFATASDMLAGSRYKFIQSVVGKYLMGEYAKGREYWVLDEDGSMMYCAGGAVTWAEGTRPEEMVAN